jgi:phage-related protein
MKPLEFLGDALKVLKTFPEAVIRNMGYSLSRVQSGETPGDAKPMKGFSASVMELVVRYDTDTYRSVYIASLKHQVYVLHVFQKKSKHGIQTPRHEIDLIEARLKKALEREADIENE